MHIIKITPHSFKIILTKDELEKHGESILENKELSKQFFMHIIDETNRLYDNPFAQGSIDAEFFESKDGGGELFISKITSENGFSYLYSTKNLENLISLCKRLCDNPPQKSRLYCENDTFFLVMHFDVHNTFTLPSIKEYGDCHKISKLKSWFLEEHADVIIRENAVQTTSLAFSTKEIE